MKSLDLQVDAPEKVSAVLRNAAQEYGESVGELQAAWTDPDAGKVWGDIARILERAARSVDNAIARRGL